MTRAVVALGSFVPEERVERFRLYWEGLTAELGRLPNRRELDPVQFRFAVGWVALVEYHRAEGRLRCRLAGERIVAALGWTRMRNRWLDSFLPAAYADESEQLVRRILDERTPLSRHRVVEFSNQGPVEILQTGFPLSPVDGEPEVVVIVFERARSPFEPLLDDDPLEGNTGLA